MLNDVDNINNNLLKCKVQFIVTTWHKKTKII